MLYHKGLLSFIVFISFIIFSTTSNATTFFEEQNKYYDLFKFFFQKQKYLIFSTLFLTSFYFIKNKKYSFSSILILTQLFVVLYWDNLIIYFENLAGDSLSEIYSFNFSYILAWIKSFFLNYLKPNLSIINFIKFYLFGLIILIILIKISFLSEKFKFIYFPLVLLIIFSYGFKEVNLDHLLKNINTQKSIKQNFVSSEVKYPSQINSNMIIFIAESNTSVLFDKKINQINNFVNDKKLGELIYLPNAYSTHSHSTPSLLRSLSIPKNTTSNNVIKPITKRESLSIFSLLDNSIEKTYLSATGKEGYNNIHYNIFFEDFDNRKFLSESKFKYEKNFFLKELYKINNKVNNLYVLHSQVGHAPYEKNVPIKYINKQNSKDKSYYKKYLGDDFRFYKDIPNYNSNLEYISDILIELISYLDNQQPNVLIFFSDHGESVFTGSGHDSSRFTNEMLRVPLFIFFNKKYLEVHNKNFKFEKNMNSILTLDIIPKIILEIYNLDKYYKKLFSKSYVQFSNLVLKRESGNNISVIDLNYNKLNLPSNYLSNNEYDTQIHVLSNNLNDSKICYHATNTIARIIRGLSLTKCIEFDMFIEDDMNYIYHSPGFNLGLTIEELLTHANDAKTLWIDAKNLNEFNCLNFSNKIIKYKEKFQIFVEFPHDTKIFNDEIKNCLVQLNNNNILTSYYVSNDEIDQCLESLSLENYICKKLIEKISSIEKNSNFTNISFDYKFMEIMSLFNFKPKNLKFNTWHIDYNEVKKVNFELFNLVIPYSSDFNRIDSN